MRRSLPLLALLLATTAGCDRLIDDGGWAAPGGEGAANSAADMIVEPGDIPEELPVPRGKANREAGPDIGPGAAPGVAFAYRYAFRLDAPRVAEVQQEHQRICERYGAARCRITGMGYRAANEEDVEAMMSFSVDPAIAGQFSRESVGAVTGADGILADSEITGTDVGGAIKTATGDVAAAQAELERIEARLARGAVSADERVRLEQEAQALREQIAVLRESQSTQESALARTPILFRYGSGNLAPGPARDPSLGEAAGAMGADVLHGSYLVLRVLIVLLPWLVLGLLGWWGVTRVRRRLAANARPAGGADAAA